jgi:Sulfotransferase family
VSGEGVSFGARLRDRLGGGARREFPTGPPAPFIVGVGRSGTTLLRLMLDSHPALAIPPETHFVPELIEAAGARRATPESVLEAIVAAKQSGWEESGVAESDLLERLGELRPLDPGGALRAFYGLYAARHGKARFGDKTPIYVTAIDAIAPALPEARFIHMIRDGRDVALSTNKRLVELRNSKPVPIEKMAKRWRDRILAARDVPIEPGRYLELRYEDLVLDTEPALHRVCEHIELDFDPVMLSYHERAGDRLQEMNRDHDRSGGRRGALSGEERMKAHALTTAPPQADRTDVWKTGMSAEDRRTFESVAGELLAELGYETGS